MLAVAYHRKYFIYRSSTYKGRFFAGHYRGYAALMLRCESFVFLISLHFVTFPTSASNFHENFF